MQTDVKDYIILKDQKNKKFLAKVVDNNPYKAIQCDKYQKDANKATYVEFELGDIVANLGKKPAFGDAYKVPIEYIRSTMDYDPWNSISFYKDLGEEQQKKVVRSIKKVTRVLEENRIFPKERGINLYIKDLKGLEGGHYRRYNDPKKEDEIVIRATEFGEIDYYMYHELGHCHYYQLCGDNIKAKWIKAFYKNKKLIEDIDSKVKKMRKELIEAGSVKAYKKELDDDDTKNVFDAVLKTLKTKYMIDANDIDSLLADNEDLSDIWPTQKIEITKDDMVLITEYALKNPKELYAECFAFYFDDTKKLPDSIEKLMSRTIQATRYGKNSHSDMDD